MVIGVGIDLVDHSRFKQELAHGAWLLEDGIFTAAEIQHCSGTKTILRFAACFAAKEAILKAMNAQIVDLAIFREVEIEAGGDGVYQVWLYGDLKRQSETLGTRKIRVSVAHSRRCTAAMALVED